MDMFGETDAGCGPDAPVDQPAGHDCEPAPPAEDAAPGRETCEGAVDHVLRDCLVAGGGDPRDLVRYELVAEWRDRCVELERQLAEIVGALGLEVRGGEHGRVPAESLAEARRIVGAGGEDSVLGQVLDKIDSGLRCTIRDFLGEALYLRAAAAAGGGWAEQVAAKLAERAAEEGDDGDGA